MKYLRHVTLSIVLALAFCSPPTIAQAPKSSAKLADLSWFIGQWRSSAGEKTSYEEHWSEPAGGAMMGMFRLLNSGKPSLYEFLLVEEGTDGVFMRLRHYGPHMVDKEKEPTRLKLTDVSATKAVFENPVNDAPKRITYALASADRLDVVVETKRGDTMVSFPLKFERVKK